jgi:hypothetical protein
MLNQRKLYPINPRLDPVRYFNLSADIFLFCLKIVGDLRQFTVLIKSIVPSLFIQANRLYIPLL